MNLFNLENKIILITGGCGVLGGGIAKYLLENNATVILLHYKEEPLTSTIKDLKQISEKVEGYVCNVVEENSMKIAAEKIMNAHGRIDALINAAGGNKPGATVGPDQSVFDVDVEQFKQVIDLNLFGSGIEGLTTYQVKNLSLIKSEISECTSSIMTIMDSKDILIEECEIYKNGYNNSAQCAILCKLYFSRI